jgi:hypothetical protein
LEANLRLDLTFGSYYFKPWFGPYTYPKYTKTRQFVVFVGWLAGVLVIVLPTKHTRSINGKSQHKNTPGNEQTTVHRAPISNAAIRQSVFVFVNVER